MSGIGFGAQAQETVGRLGREPSTWWLLAGVTCFFPLIGPIVALVVLIFAVAIDLYKNRVGRSGSWVLKAWLIGVGVPVLYAVLFATLLLTGFRFYVESDWKQESAARMAELEERKAAVPEGVPVSKELEERWRLEREQIERETLDEETTRISTVVSISSLIALFAGFGAYRLLRRLLR